MNRTSFRTEQHENNQLSVAIHRCSKPAPLILALHGFTGSGQDFDPLRLALGEDRAHWICPDFPGHGKSSCPDDESFYALPALLENIHGMVEQVPYRIKTILLGYSMGARVGLHYLRRFKVDNAVFVSCSPGIRHTADREKRSKQDEKWIEMLQDPGCPMSLFCSRWESQPVIQPQTTLAEPLRSEIAHRRRSNNPVGLAYSLRALGSGSLPHCWDALDQLTNILLITGEKDQKFHRIAKDMMRINPQIRHEEIAQTGHSPHLENPMETAKVLKQVLEEC